MPISFSCHQCGRNLKAPDNAAGKSSKCPGCGATVTCPEAVYNAELLEAPPAEAEAYAVADPDGAYAMAAPPVAAAAQEARRPCPMCGEMIVVGAAKCRFCGEIFDETLKKAGLGGNPEARSIASAHRNLVICVVLFVICAFGQSAIRRAMAMNPDPALGLVSLVIAAITLAAWIGLAIYIFLIARKLDNLGIGILLGLLAIIPCVNLVLAFMINQRVNRYLQDNGYKVGFLGAKVP
jgi:predicted RNA-binding Zn-ribbon protein involved in translation (DUF1610 family)